MAGGLLWLVPLDRACQISPWPMLSNGWSPVVVLAGWRNSFKHHHNREQLSSIHLVADRINCRGPQRYPASRSSPPCCMEPSAESTISFAARHGACRGSRTLPRRSTSGSFPSSWKKRPPCPELAAPSTIDPPFPEPRSRRLVIGQVNEPLSTCGSPIVAFRR